MERLKPVPYMLEARRSLALRSSLAERRTVHKSSGPPRRSAVAGREGSSCPPPNGGFSLEERGTSASPCRLRRIGQHCVVARGMRVVGRTEQTNSDTADMHEEACIGNKKADEERCDQRSRPCRDFVGTEAVVN